MVFDPLSSSSSLLSSLLHSYVNLKWCEKIKLSNLLLPRKGGTIKSLRLLSTSETLLVLGPLGYKALGPLDWPLIDALVVHLLEERLIYVYVPKTQTGVLLHTHE